MAKKKATKKKATKKKATKKKATKKQSPKKKKTKKKTKKMPKSPKEWENYEEVSRHILNLCSNEFGVDFFEPKQKLKGANSQADWEIDAKGVREDDGAIIVVECRRTKSKQSQGNMGELAYRIKDLGGIGGIIVSPHDIQKGAILVAKAEKIVRVRLNPKSTVDSFHAEFIDKLKVVAGMPMVITGGPPSDGTT